MTMFKKKKKKKKSHRICNAIDAVQRNRRVHETVNAGYIRTLKEEEEKEEEIDDSSGNQMCIAVGQRPWHTIRRINDFTGNKVLHPITVGHGWLIHDIALTFDQHTSSLEIIANFVPTLFHRQKNIRLETRKVWRGRQQLFPHMLFSHTPPPSPLLSSRWVTQQPIWRHIHSKSHQNPVFLTNNNRGGGMAEKQMNESMIEQQYRLMWCVTYPRQTVTNTHDDTINSSNNFIPDIAIQLRSTQTR